MKCAGWLLALWLGLLAPVATAAERAVVIVCASEYPLAALPLRDIRRAYLGLPVTWNDRPLRAVRNTSDTHLYEIFLQKVAFMSEATYERRLTAEVFRRGLTRPPAYDSREALVDYLTATPGALSFMWYHEAAKDPRIRIVQTLWKGNAAARPTHLAQGTTSP